jgi:hypothetical protein
MIVYRSLAADLPRCRQVIDDMNMISIGHRS